MSGYLNFYAQHPALQKIADAINDAGHAYHNTAYWQEADWTLGGKKTRCEAVQEAFDAADAMLKAATPSQGLEK